jgi:hypothetical protein
MPVQTGAGIYNRAKLISILLMLFGSGAARAADSIYTCTPCPAGTYSDGNVTECTPCEAGTYQPNAGAASCNVCPAGYYTNAEKTTYTVCPTGSYCIGGIKYTCPSGQYQPSTGQASCRACSGHYGTGKGGSISEGGKFFNWIDCAATSTTSCGVSECYDEVSKHFDDNPYCSRNSGLRKAANAWCAKR